MGIALARQYASTSTTVQSAHSRKSQPVPLGLPSCLPHSASTRSFPRLNRLWAGYIALLCSSHKVHFYPDLQLSQTQEVFPFLVSSLSFSSVSQTTYMFYFSFLCLVHFHSFRLSFFLCFLFTPNSLCLTSGHLGLNSCRSPLDKQFPSNPLNKGKSSILFSHVITCLGCSPSTGLLLISNCRL